MEFNSGVSVAMKPISYSKLFLYIISLPLRTYQSKMLNIDVLKNVLLLFLMTSYLTFRTRWKWGCRDAMHFNDAAACCLLAIVLEII
jgi:hypothetical protein